MDAVMVSVMDSTIQIPLSRGMVAVIDASDSHILDNQWHATFKTQTSYARASVKLPEGSRLVFMHRLILGFPDSVIDHIDGNGLNNRRSNLRIASAKENAWNRRLSIRNISSRYKAVSLRANGQWQVRVRSGSKCFTAQFDSEEHAGRAYDVIAHAWFGTFARLNFPGELEYSEHVVRGSFNRQRQRNGRFDGLITTEARQ